MIEQIDLQKSIDRIRIIGGGRGRFRFIGLPLKIRGATASPIRAIAVIEREMIREVTSC